MNSQLHEFSPSQWEFLALLDIFGDPIPIDVASDIQPMRSSELLSLIEKATSLGWLFKTDNLDIGLNRELPPHAKIQIKQINSETRCSDIMSKLQFRDLQSKLSPKALSNVMSKSGQTYESAVLEYEQLRMAVQNKKYHEVEELLNKVLQTMEDHKGEKRYDKLFISSFLQVALACDILGRNISPLLHQALEIAEQLGDERNHTIFTMYVGWLHTLEGDFKQGISVLEPALEKIKAFGDPDIMNQALEFYGIYYFSQGLYKEAAHYFERALQAEAAGYPKLMSTYLPMITAYALIITGKIHRAVGVLDCAWRKAQINSNEKLATFYRGGLGVMLIQWGEKQKALPHLEACLVDSQMQKNYWTLGESLNGMALYHFSEGRIEKAYEYALKCNTNIGNVVPAGQHPIWPQTIEMLFAFGKMGFGPIPNFPYEQKMDSYLNGPNIHRRGVCRYIQAKDILDNGGDPAHAKPLLEESLSDLKRSGDLITEAKCEVALARILYNEGNIQEAQKVALQAWEILSGYGDNVFPHEISLESLKPLLGISSLNTKQTTPINLFEKFIELTDEFIPTIDKETFLSRLIYASSRFFESERGGIFVLEKEKPVLYAGYNMTRSDINSDRFHFSLEQIRKVFKNEQPLIIRPINIDKKNISSNIPSLLCLPFEYKNKLKGVIYHDNSYTDKSYDTLDRDLLLKISRHLSKHIARIWEYMGAKEKTMEYQKEVRCRTDGTDNNELKYQSPLMQDLLVRAEQAAMSEATILILGETGAGKELLARQIHSMSSRKDEPFVVVDLTSIPETLVESELFGHEKGAFTGADRQKRGRMELAHGGTLFIDEIGDIPKSSQVKLLRALQEKTFSRVGATRTISSDFRLVAATNRDLALDVEKGTFREDLYYRINVVPLYLPPLRERGKDVLYLAQHYLDFFAKKYKRYNLQFTADDKSKLISYSWPGNVRELKNIIERFVIMSTTNNPELIIEKESKASSDNLFADKPTLDELQRKYIRYIIDQTGGKISGPLGAAKILGMKRTTLYTRMKKLGLE